VCVLVCVCLCVCVCVCMCVCVCEACACQGPDIILFVNKSHTVISSIFKTIKQWRKIGWLGNPQVLITHHGDGEQSRGGAGGEKNPIGSDNVTRVSKIVDPHSGCGRRDDGRTKCNCKLQMGGSDQWGNITTGTEIIRRKAGKEAFGLTCPLIRKADGTKFGKTEGGNIWLEARYTSPYRFYQFWLSVSDEDAQSYIKIFTFLDQEEINELIARHMEAPHLRELQKTLAQEVTTDIHGKIEFEKAVAASAILFGGNPTEAIAAVDETTMLDVFSGVPHFEIALSELQAGIPFSTLVTEKAAVFASKGELRRLVQGGGISLSGIKITESETSIDASSLIKDKYLLIQKGKKNYFLITAK